VEAGRPSELVALTSTVVGARYPAAPLGLITVAALLPPSWEVRLVNRNTETLETADFDQIGATLENASRLHAAGVQVAIQSAGSHHARKVRQMAGNAVANGLPWEDGLAALTRVPAEAFGVAGDIGTIAPGKRADLVVVDGDPLERLDDIGRTVTTMRGGIAFPAAELYRAVGVEPVQ